MMRSLTIGLLALCLSAACAGCSRSPRISFYTLEPGAGTVAVTAAGAAALPPLEPGAKSQTAGAEAHPSVAVGPVTLPELVDRPQLVVRVADNRVEVLEAQRWAEPLKSEIPRLIAENLGRLLGSNRVASYLQYAGAAADYRVLVDIRRFEASPGEGVTVEVVWTLRRAAGGAPKTGHTLAREAAGAPGYQPLVAAYGRALLAVSGDLARAIRAEAAVVQ